MKIKKAFLLVPVLLFYISAPSYGQAVNHWETVVQAGDNCNYLIPSSDIGVTWIDEAFDDSSWTTAPSGIGYGDGDDNTVIATGTASVYLRFNFSIVDVNDIEVLLLDMDYDDGFVAYLNGSEVARANVSNPISWNMTLDAVHEAALHSGGKPERYNITEQIANLLKNGNNVLAVEVHNESPTSSDLSSNVFLHVGLGSSTLSYSPTPAWFWEPIALGGFNLPLMVINTEGQNIPDDPRIVANMGLINNGEGELNFLGDFQNEYSGKISIETRGESSSGFAKKSYSIELQNADGSNNNVEILGLPIENDFVLYGPYSDKTMMKNVLTYELFRRTGRWAPRTRYIEIMLNGNYQGVYVLTEKVKRDDNRVDMDKLTAEDVTPEDISGGYLLRRDKKNGVGDEEWWTSPVGQPYHERMWYQYFDPKRDELTDLQADYIKGWMKNFDEVMSSQHFADPDFGYRNYIKTNSFIDMMFINEISKGIDNYLFSTYFYKENDSDGGQLVAGPPWDYNLGYGNLNYGDDWDAKETYGWSYPQGSRVYWYERLMEDEEYRNRVYCRWSKFRDTVFSDDAVNSLIDSCVAVIGDAADRNFERFPTLGQYVWPAVPPYPTTYEGEVANLRTWLIDRLAWMDGEWRGIGVCSTQPPTDLKLDHSLVLSNMPAGTLVGRFSTVDPDEADTHRYKLTGGTGDEDNDSFEVYGNELLTKETFDISIKDTYTIRVQTKDTGGDELEKAFEIIIDDGTILIVPVEEAATYSVFPIPTRGIIQIVDTNNLNETATISVIDMAGVTYINYTGRVADINEELAMTSSSLRSGVYILHINNGIGSQALRFIKVD